jgi:nucleoside 2-deoxyribosyltransferase
VKVIYIAGKYRGPNAWAIEQNIRAAEDVAARVWAMGHVALCPHANSRHMDGVASDEVFLAGTLELMRRCDAVVLVWNWEGSEGACAEVAEARRRGIPVFGADAWSSAIDGQHHTTICLQELEKWIAAGEEIDRAYRAQCEAVQA